MAGIRFPGVTHGHQGESKDTVQQHKHCRANLRNKIVLSTEDTIAANIFN